MRLVGELVRIDACSSRWWWIDNGSGSGEQFGPSDLGSSFLVSHVLGFFVLVCGFVC